MKDLYKEKEREFYSLYQECDQINTINHELNDELEDLEQENGNLENECWQL